MTAYRQLITNDQGEPLGIEYIHDDAPEPDDYDGPMYDYYEPNPEDCDGTHPDAHEIDGDLWECDICEKRFSYTEVRGVSYEEFWGSI